MEPLRIPLQPDAAHRAGTGPHAGDDAVGDGLHIAIHEAALVDYSSMWLRRVAGQRLKASLSPSADGARVRRAAPFATPWRTLQIADSAAGLYMSDLILNLNEPNALGDVSWVRPFKYVGIWWGMHLGTGDLGLGAEAWRDDGEREALHRLCGGERFPRRAGRGLEQGLGRRLVRRWQQLQLHRALSGLRPRRGRGLRPRARRAPDRPSRDVRLTLRTTRTSSRTRSICMRTSASTASRPDTSPMPAASRPVAPTVRSATNGTMARSCRATT